MELTNIVNIFDQTKRKIRCIENIDDYFRDGTVVNKEPLEIGKEYTYIKGSAEPYGMMVFIEEVQRDKYGFQSYLFEEVEPYDKEILKKQYEEWLEKELDKGLQSIKEGRTYTEKELKEHLGLLRKKIKKKHK